MRLAASNINEQLRCIDVGISRSVQKGNVQCLQAFGQLRVNVFNDKYSWLPEARQLGNGRTQGWWRYIPLHLNETPFAIGKANLGVGNPLGQANLRFQYSGFLGCGLLKGFQRLSQD